MPLHEELKARAARAYNAASDHYDAPANSFWSRFGRRTIDRLELEPGMRVLDACCGTGASAIPAAQAVGSSGCVVAVDVADDLLTLLRQKADGLGLSQLQIRSADILSLNLSEPGFDAVVCVFGIFFVGDMAEAVRHLYRQVAPGGQLAITTWGPRLFEPANSHFWESIRSVRADLYKAFNPWDVITTPKALRALLADGGVIDPQIVEESATHPIPSPADWWAVVMGSGYRGTVDRLSPRERARVREMSLRHIADERIAAVETNVLYAVSRKNAT